LRNTKNDFPPAPYAAILVAPEGDVEAPHFRKTLSDIRKLDLPEESILDQCVAVSIENSCKEAGRQMKPSQIIEGSHSVKSREPETSKIFHFEDAPGNIFPAEPISVRNGRAGNLDYLLLQMD